jgi:endonuclease-3
MSGIASSRARDRASLVLQALRKDYPDAHIELDYSNPLELLIATILSAQCTDKRVNQLTATLFKKYRTAEDYAKADPAELERDIMPAGFFRNKTKSIQGCTRMLIEKSQGRVPGTLEELVQCPGVGRKTANVILGGWFGIPGITVDTHVLRLARRLGLSRNADPVRMEFDLQKLLPQPEWSFFSNALIWHGRRVCHARKPKCPACSMKGFCPSASSKNPSPGVGRAGRRSRAASVPSLLRRGGSSRRTSGRSAAAHHS